MSGPRSESATDPADPAEEVSLLTETPEQTEAVGLRLAGLLRAGDLLVLTGDLGAGKTALTRGIGRGLGVRGAVTSPTFVISRVHPSLADGPALVHVDAYRLGAVREIDDLDLDASLADAVTVVEWGAGVSEQLTDSRLEITLTRPVEAGADTRRLRLRPQGPRWAEVDLAARLTGGEDGSGDQ